jgi:hypothetical protein
VTDYAAEAGDTTAGATLTRRTLAATGDTVPAGALLLIRNTGAGAHTLTVANNYTTDTGVPPVRSFPVAAGTFGSLRVNRNWGDSNGRCAVTMSGTVAEVETYICA